MCEPYTPLCKMQYHIHSEQTTAEQTHTKTQSAATQNNVKNDGSANCDHLEEKKESETNYDNWVPPEKRVAIDEYYDLTSIKPLMTEDLLGDGSLILMTVKEGQGSIPEQCDTVYCKKETRFDTGQLVDRTEKRQIAEKYPLKDKRYFQYLLLPMTRMRRGQVCFLKIGWKHHKGQYLE